MADEKSTSGQPQQQQVQLQINEAQMTTSYANIIRTSTTPDEVVMDFGMNMPVPNPENKPVLRFDVNNRIVMNWRGAKQLAISLGQVIQQFEQANGEIPIGNQQRGGGPRLAN
ncbi:hypothetical protein BH11PLA1_BH11PLA1_05840 [soil metagenome]